MILWGNKELKYSLLISGEMLDVERIGNCLKEGIKIFWFGRKEDCETLNSLFPHFIKSFFLYTYQNTNGIRLLIIDGVDIEKNHDALEKLENGDPSFNLKQYEIEHNGSAPFVVVQAGAGSGKTFVMNNRLLFLLHTKKDFKLSDVTMVTFTNEATDSMRRKLIELLNNKIRLTGNTKYLQWIEEISQISISTIHSFFRRIIIEIGPLLGYGTNLRMSNMALEKRSILREILEERFGSRNESVSAVLGLSVYELEKLAIQFWKKIENNGMSEAYVASMDWGSTNTAEATRIQASLRQIFEEVEEKYNARKLENNAIAMSDIIHEFSRVVKDERIKEYITTQYKYLFCDEFQDSDDVQIQTIAVLDRIYRGNLFVVGDIKQSIYRFRGATDSAFERLDQDMMQEFGSDCTSHTFSLAKNYRTSKDILQEIDKIFRMWGDRGYLKYKYTGDNNDVLTPQICVPGVYKQIKVYGRLDLEKKFISLVDKLQRDSANKKKSIMVLTRDNRQLQTVKEWCEKAGKACIIRERGGFFNSVAVRDFCALVEAMLYYSEPMYLFNLLRSAYCYKTVDTEMLKSFSGSSKEITKYLSGLINEELPWDRILEELRNRPVMSVLCEIITAIRPSINHGAIMKDRYIEVDGYGNEEGTKQAILDAKQYEANLQKLLQMLFDSFSGEFSSLSDICNYVRTRMNTDTEEESAKVPSLNDINCIQGSTVHGAKGLEFDYVLIPFMNDRFVRDYRSEILIDKERKQVGWQYKESLDGRAIRNRLYDILRPDENREVIGDETRLLYVAMTRPIEGLFCFTWWKRNKGTAQTWSDLLPEDKDDENYIRL